MLRLSNLITTISNKYGISPRLYAAILMQESAYKLNALNTECGVSLKSVSPLHARTTASLKTACIVHDIGIAQINFKTVDKYKFDIRKLTTDQEYSIEAGAKVLSWFKNTYGKSDPNWWTRYNCGTKARTDRTTCVTYKRLVSRYL